MRDVGRMQSKRPQGKKEEIMTTRSTNLMHRSAVSILRLALLGILVTATSLLLAAEKPAAHGQAARLVQLVRNATKGFQDVSNVPAGYGPFLGCVSGPDHGAMGIHYVNGNFVADGEIDANKPEALIYEPTDTGLRLVGVEFIVDAATWLSKHSAPPVLEGQTFQLVNAPNRYA